MKKVIVVNGRPRAGKDTAIAFMQGILQEHRIASIQFSSIDPVRDVVQRLGIDVSAKTPADRALLAEIGSSVEKHSGYRSKACLTEALRFFASHSKAVVFLHIREPAMIETVAAGLDRMAKIDLISVLVESERAEHVTSNAADMGVEGLSYNAKLSNHGSLPLLEANCRCLLHTLGLLNDEPRLL